MKNSLTSQIKNKIHTIRGLQVIIDSDLAELYEVKTKALNQAVKRNAERFPKDFMFQLNDIEKTELVTNCDHLKSLKYSYQTPHAFTEQGVAMISSVLNSKKAIEVNIQIMRAFIAMRKFISNNAQIFIRLDSLERKQIEYDKHFEIIFDKLQDKIPEKGIFFDGQIFDAYKFVSDIIRTAKTSILLIDNYVDDSVLTLLNKRKRNVNVTILTKITKELHLDIDKHNQQYPKIEIKEFNDSHDRFLIIDNQNIYHFGASLKDLGKKWFGFSKFDKESINILTKLNNI